MRKPNTTVFTGQEKQEGFCGASCVPCQAKKLGRKVGEKGSAIAPAAALYIVGLRRVLFRFLEL